MPVVYGVNGPNESWAAAKTTIRKLTAVFEEKIDTVNWSITGAIGGRISADLTHLHFQLDRKLDRQTRLIYTSLGLLFAMQAATIWLVLCNGQGTRPAT